jgi:uncharacterized membrane protein
VPPPPRPGPRARRRARRRRPRCRSRPRRPSRERDPAGGELGRHRRHPVVELERAGRGFGGRIRVGTDERPREPDERRHLSLPVAGGSGELQRPLVGELGEREVTLLAAGVAEQVVGVALEARADPGEGVAGSLGVDHRLVEPTGTQQDLRPVAAGDPDDHREALGLGEVDGLVGRVQRRLVGPRLEVTRALVGQDAGLLELVASAAGGGERVGVVGLVRPAVAVAGRDHRRRRVRERQRPVVPGPGRAGHGRLGVAAGGLRLATQPVRRRPPGEQLDLRGPGPGGRALLVRGQRGVEVPTKVVHHPHAERHLGASGLVGRRRGRGAVGDRRGRTVLGPRGVEAAQRGGPLPAVGERLAVQPLDPCGAAVSRERSGGSSHGGEPPAVEQCLAAVLEERRGRVGLIGHREDLERRAELTLCRQASDDLVDEVGPVGARREGDLEQRCRDRGHDRHVPRAGGARVAARGTRGDEPGGELAGRRDRGAEHVGEPSRAAGAEQRELGEGPFVPVPERGEQHLADVRPHGSIGRREPRDPGRAALLGHVVHRLDEQADRGGPPAGRVHDAGGERAVRDQLVLEQLHHPGGVEREVGGVELQRGRTRPVARTHEPEVLASDDQQLRSRPHGPEQAPEQLQRAFTGQQVRVVEHDPGGTDAPPAVGDLRGEPGRIVARHLHRRGPRVRRDEGRGQTCRRTVREVQRAPGGAVLGRPLRCEGGLAPAGARRDRHERARRGTPDQRAEARMLGDPHRRHLRSVLRSRYPEHLVSPPRAASLGRPTADLQVVRIPLADAVATTMGSRHRGRRSTARPTDLTGDDVSTPPTPGADDGAPSARPAWETAAATTPAASEPAGLTPASATPAGTTPGAATQGTSTGLDPKVGGLLAYFGIIGIVLFFLEKTHREVRFHAAQNTILCIGLFAVYVGIAVVGVVIPFVWLLNLPLWLASFALWIYLCVQGYNLNHVKLPVIGDLAESWAAK